MQTIAAAGHDVIPRRTRLPEVLALACGMSTKTAQAIVATRGELRVREALDASCGCARPDLWEKLASSGYVPFAWVGNPDRAFLTVCSHCDGDGRIEPDKETRAEEPCQTCGGVAAYEFDAPPSICDCVALASDAGNAAHAEVLGREIARRLGAAAARVAWRFQNARWYPRHDKRPEWKDALARVRYEPKDEGLWNGSWYDTSLRLQGRHERYESQVANTILRAKKWPDAATNPFAPLLEMFELGYALDRIEDDRIVLMCPVLDDGKKP